MINLFFRSVRGFVTLLLVLVATTAFADDTDYIKVYYPVINKAELNLVKGDYTTALALYHDAFAAVPAPFARDYYNAAICAMLLKDKKKTFDYLEVLAIKGVSLAYLEKQSVFDSLQTTRQWRKFKKKYPKYRQKYNDGINQDLRADLDELYAKDQYFRQAKGSIRVYADTLRKIEAENTKDFLQWVEKYGYPGEALIGVGDTLEHLPRFSVIIQRQTKARKGYDFSEILQQAVQQGRLNPQAAAYLIEQQAGSGIYGSKAFVKVECAYCEDKSVLSAIDKYLEEKRSEKQLGKINKRRNALGLESLEDYKQKVLYSLKDNRFMLSYNWSVANYHVPSTEAAKVILEDLVIAEATHDE